MKYVEDIYEDVIGIIRNLNNGAKVLLSIISTIGIILLFEEYDILDIDGISFLKLAKPRMASLDTPYKIDGIVVNFEQLYFFLIILFNYCLFWGFKKKSDSK